MDSAKAHPWFLLRNLTFIYIERIACNCVLCTHIIFLFIRKKRYTNKEQNQHLMMRNIYFHELLRLLTFSCKFSYILWFIPFLEFLGFIGCIWKEVHEFRTWAYECSKRPGWKHGETEGVWTEVFSTRAKWKKVPFLFPLFSFCKMI